MVGLALVCLGALVSSVFFTSADAVRPNVVVLGVAQTATVPPPTEAPTVASVAVRPVEIRLVEPPSLSAAAPVGVASSGDAREPTRSPEIDDVVSAALLLVRFDWEARFPEWQIEFLEERDGLRALTFPRLRRVEVYVRDQDTASSLHRVIAHELGHVVDVELNSPAERADWVLERGLGDDVDWWPSASAPDFATGAGDFAEAFAVWEAGTQSQSTVAGQPDAQAVALLAELAAG